MYILLRNFYESSYFLTYVTDADDAIHDGDKDLLLRDDADLGDGPLAEVLVWAEELDIRGTSGPPDHAILQDAPLGRADKKVVPTTKRHLVLECYLMWKGHLERCL